MNLIILGVELAGLYLLSRWLTQTIYSALSEVFRNRSFGVSFTTLLLFPGTVIHELSHLFVAEVLGVRTGKLTLVPEGIQSPPAGGEIQTGSVAIAKTGPFRRAFIGLSPLVVGIIALGGLSYLHATQFVNNKTITIVYYYLIFAISNSMFPSAVDMRGVWQLMVTLLIILIGAGIAGFRIVIPQSAPVFMTDLINSLIANLGIVLALNGIILLLFSLLITMMRKTRI